MDLRHCCAITRYNLIQTHLVIRFMHSMDTFRKAPKSVVDVYLPLSPLCTYPPRVG